GHFRHLLAVERGHVVHDRLAVDVPEVVQQAVERALNMREAVLVDLLRLALRSLSRIGRGTGFHAVLRRGNLSRRQEAGNAGRRDFKKETKKPDALKCIAWGCVPGFLPS